MLWSVSDRATTPGPKVFKVTPDNRLILSRKTYGQEVWHPRRSLDPSAFDCFTKQCDHGVEFILKLMFPDSDNVPACTTKKGKVPSITFSITFNFLLPKHGELMFPEWKSPSVPEVAVNEDCHSFRRKNYVWFSPQMDNVFSETISAKVERRTNLHFQGRILTAYARHAVASLILC